MTMRRTHVTRNRPRLDRGATAVEYAIIASLIAAVIAATVALLGLDTLDNWDSVGW